MNPLMPDFDIAFTEAELDSVFAVADLHFGHANIIKYCQRPFATPNEMDQELIARWNRTVPRTATVWVLGDVTIRPEKLRAVLNQLNGRKILVAGNHDQPHPISLHNKNRSEDELWRYAKVYREAGFEAVHLGGAFTLPNFGRVLVCHYPYSARPDWLGARFPDDGVTSLLHGHVHEKWRFNGRMLNVGVEVQDYRPVSLREIRDAFCAEQLAGWPSQRISDDEPPAPAAAEAEIPPDKRLHRRGWFEFSGQGSVPELPGTIQRWHEVAGERWLEVAVDGQHPDARTIWRRCTLSAALLPLGWQLLSPNLDFHVRKSLEERITAFSQHYPRIQTQIVDVPTFEVPAVLKWLKTLGTLSEPQAWEDDARIGTIWECTTTDGIQTLLKRLARRDEFDQMIPASEVAHWELHFPPGWTHNDAVLRTLSLARQLPLRELKPLIILEVE